ncbi:MAG: S8 family serine peptidase [Bacteroidota bacterium]|nr:S8 family serine peptidase [Bacteroidota bacterium]
MNYFLSISFFICTLSVFSQTGDKYFILLSDKTGTPFTTANPQQFLSQRAIDRRTNQGIAINETDLPVNPSYVSQISSAGATVLYTSKWFNAVVAVIPNPTVLASVNALPFVSSSATVNRLHGTIPKQEIEIVSSGSKLSSVNSMYDYGGSLNQIEMLNGVCMHDQGFNGAGMLIAVLDAGFANADTHSAFDSLWANNQILGTKDFTFTTPLDLYSSSTSGHGTSVLSCIGGNIPGQLVGTAPKANFWLIRSEFANTEYIVEEYNWVAAAEFADSVGADIINSSLGYNTFDNASQDHTMSQLDGRTSYASLAANMCARKGIVVCNSAGNSGTTSWPKITFPADADSILTVGGVDPNENIASFSSMGPSADGRVKPEVVAQAVGSVLASGTNNIITGNGTSFSSPITAGMVACLWQSVSNKKNMEIIEAIKQSSSLYTTPNNQFGYGIPDYCAARSILVGINEITANSSSLLSLNSSNPFSDEIKFSVNSTKASPVKIYLYNSLGALVFYDELTASSSNGKQIYSISTESIAAGFYTLVARSETGTVSYKLIKADRN